MLHVTDNLLYARECALNAGGITLLSAFLSRKLNSPALSCFIDMVMAHPVFEDYIQGLEIPR